MITTSYTLKGHNGNGPDDPGEATRWRLEFTDEHRKGWTWNADPDVRIRLLMATLERAFELGGHTRIDDDMKTTVRHVVNVFEDSDVL
jgi:hypothetical protein